MSAVIQLSKIESIDLRKAWPDEAKNFTPWLAEEENLALLGSTLGLQLELEAVEKQVGPFSADILAKECASGRWVLIENQIEITDHGHLGQILTYAAGLDVGVVIWIARSFREQHRAAIDYLNRITDEDHLFFGVQVELLKIGDSAYAPSFSVVAKPNDWSKQSAAAKFAAEDALSPTQALNREFWSRLIAEASLTYPSLATRTPYKGNWQTAERLFSSKKLVVEANATFTQGKLRAEIYLGGVLAKAAFSVLRDEVHAIQASLEQSLDWEELPTKQDSRVSLYMPGEQRREDRSAWPAQTKWLLTHLRKLADEFRPRLNKLDLSALQTDDVQSLLG